MKQKNQTAVLKHCDAQRELLQIGTLLEPQLIRDDSEVKFVVHKESDTFIVECPYCGLKEEFCGSYEIGHLEGNPYEVERFRCDSCRKVYSTRIGSLYTIKIDGGN